MSGDNTRRLTPADIRRAPIIGMRTPERMFHVGMTGRTNGDGFVLETLRIEGLSLMEFREIMRSLSALTMPPQQPGAGEEAQQG